MWLHNQVAIARIITITGEKMNMQLLNAQKRRYGRGERRLNRYYNLSFGKRMYVNSSLGDDESASAINCAEEDERDRAMTEKLTKLIT